MPNKFLYICDCIIEYCLYLLILFLPFSKAMMQCFAWLAIFVWIIKKIVSHKNKDVILPADIKATILLFIIACIVSTAFSFDFTLAFKALLTKVAKQVLIFLILINTINTKKRFRNILLFFLISIVVVMIDAGFQYYAGSDLFRGYKNLEHRLQASFTTPIGFGGWLIIVIPVVFVLIHSDLYSRKKIFKFYFFLLLALLTMSLLLTYSRSSWLGFIFSLALIAYLIDKKYKKREAVIIFLFIALIISTTVLFFSPVKEIIRSTLLMKGSIPLRLTLAKDCLELIKDFPIFGIGLNNYSKAIVFYKTTSSRLYPHNSYLQMFSEIGAFGLLTFLNFSWVIFKTGYKTVCRTGDIFLIGFLAAFAATLIQSLFDSNLYSLQLALLFWYISGLIVARALFLTNNDSSVNHLPLT